MAIDGADQMFAQDTLHSFDQPLPPTARRMSENDFDEKHFPLRSLRNRVHVGNFLRELVICYFAFQELIQTGNQLLVKRNVAFAFHLDRGSFIHDGKFGKIKIGRAIPAEVIALLVIIMELPFVINLWPKTI
jgi:hypothetical protein